jgi:hypothetical protein
MTLAEIFEDVNIQTDEDFDIETLLPFFNDSIAFINRKKKTYYPFLPTNTSPDTIYEPIRETWQRQIIVNYMGHLVKTIDSSQFEYTDFLRKAQEAMEDFMQVKDPAEYASDAYDDDGEGVEVYQTDNRNNIMNNRW